MVREHRFYGLHSPRPTGKAYSLLPSMVEGPLNIFMMMWDVVVRESRTEYSRRAGWEKSRSIQSFFTKMYRYIVK